MIALRRLLLICAFLGLASGLAWTQESPSTGEPARAAKAAGQGQPEAAAERQLAEASSEAAKEEPFKFFGREIPSPAVEALKWGNFVVLFGLLGWLLRKPVKQFLVTRTAQIRESLEAGRRARAEAAARLQEIEAQVAGLGADIAGLKQNASAAAQAERQRLLKNAEAEAARILAQAQQEIEALIKAVQKELKKHAAELAVNLAEQRLRARLTPARQAALVREYATELAQQR